MILIKFIIKINSNKGDGGLGMGDWGLGIGDWAQSPIPHPPSPIPHPPYIVIFLFLIFIKHQI